MGFGGAGTTLPPKWNKETDMHDEFKQGPLITIYNYMWQGKNSLKGGKAIHPTQTSSLLTHWTSHLPQSKARFLALNKQPDQAAVEATTKGVTFVHPACTKWLGTGGEASTLQASSVPCSIETHCAKLLHALPFHSVAKMSPWASGIAGAMVSTIVPGYRGSVISLA